MRLGGAREGMDWLGWVRDGEGVVCKFPSNRSGDDCSSPSPATVAAAPRATEVEDTRPVTPLVCIARMELAEGEAKCNDGEGPL